MNTQLLGNFFQFIFAICYFTFLLPLILIQDILVQTYSNGIFYSSKLFYVIEQGVIEIFYTGIAEF